MDSIISILMSQLQIKNPQGFQMVQSAMQNGGNPQNILQQMIGNTNSQQFQQIMQQAKQIGVPDAYLAQIQNMNGTKK